MQLIRELSTIVKIILIKVLIMDQKQAPPQRVRIVRPQTSLQFSLGPRGIIFFLLGILVLCLGVIGYLKYDSIVKPYLEVYICCLPAIIIAVLFFLFGFATQVTTLRQVQVRKPSWPQGDQNVEYLEPEDIQDVTPAGKIQPKNKLESGHKVHEEFTSARYRNNGLRRYEPSLEKKEDLLAQTRNLNQFLKNLDEQHNDGLIMDDVYFNLKVKYRRELQNLNLRSGLKEKKIARKIKSKKK